MSDLIRLLLALAFLVLFTGTDQAQPVEPGDGGVHGGVRDVTHDVSWQPDLIARGLARGRATVWGPGQGATVYRSRAKALRIRLSAVASGISPASSATVALTFTSR